MTIPEECKNRICLVDRIDLPPLEILDQLDRQHLLFGLKVTAFYAVITFFGAMATASLLSRLGMADRVKPLVGL